MIQRTYQAKVLFEASIDTRGNNYLVIYGKHINGYFCCIPNWRVSCEMTEPSDLCYNRSALNDAGIGMGAAKEIAEEIANYMAAHPEEQTVCDNCPYRETGSPDGDCIYAGLCCYGIAKESE